MDIKGYTTRQAGERLGGVSRQRVWQLAQRDNWQVVAVIGNSLVYRIEDVEATVAKRSR